MELGSSSSFIVEWQAGGPAADDLVMSMRFGDRSELRRFAMKLDAPPVLRVQADDGRAVVTTANAVLRWSAEDALPPPDGNWAEKPTNRRDEAIAIDMLEALLAWTRSRGLIDEAKSRRISRAVQIELAGATDDRPG